MMSGHLFFFFFNGYERGNHYIKSFQKIFPSYGDLNSIILLLFFIENKNPFLRVKSTTPNMPLNEVFMQLKAA